MKKFSIWGSFLSVVLLLLVSAKTASAGEGIIELKNTIGEDARCFTTSILMQDLQYNVLISCRDIIYPGGTDIFNYIVWSTPQTGGVERLGELGLGKVEFKTKNPFTSLFVTRERDRKTTQPSGQVVMQGSVQNITFLDPANKAQAQAELGSPTVTASPIPTPKPTSAVSRILAAGGVIAFIALFGVILLVFVVTRK